jgi:hypothetical protein
LKKYSTTVAALASPSASQKSHPRRSIQGRIRSIGSDGNTSQKVAWA